MADFSSCQTFPVGLSAGLHFKQSTFLFAPLLLLDVSFGPLCCWRTHDLCLKSSFLGVDLFFFFCFNLLAIFQFHVMLWCLKAAPEHHGSSTMLSCEGVLFLVSFIVLSLNTLEGLLRSSFCFICPQNVLWFGKDQSMYVFSIPHCFHSSPTKLGLVCGIHCL